MLALISVGLSALVLGLFTGSGLLTSNISSGKNSETSNFTRKWHNPKCHPHFEHGFRHGIDPIVNAIFTGFNKLDDISKNNDKLKNLYSAILTEDYKVCKKQFVDVLQKVKADGHDEEKNIATELLTEILQFRCHNRQFDGYPPRHPLFGNPPHHPPFEPPHGAPHGEPFGMMMQPSHDMYWDKMNTFDKITKILKDYIAVV